MAKNDYFTIVAKILGYLYSCLKDGTDPDPDMLGTETKWYTINERYWLYIMKHRICGGYIEGAEYKTAIDGSEYVVHLEHAQITPEGIEYLMDNKMIKKVVEVMKTTREIIG